MELIPRITSYKLQTFYAIFCCLLASYCNADSADSEKESSWAPFCNQEIFYKPYVRIREGRKGPVIKELGPGLHEVKDMENIYVCCNGLVFLYFKIHEKEHGQIYDDAVMQYASHYCGFYNGRPGPGMFQRENTLVAILLLGHADDYRQVAMQMFTAPLFNPATNSSTNFTSLAIINTDGECILERGREKARIRVKGNPSEDIQKKTYEATEEHHTTLCRLDGHLLMQDDDSKIPLDKEWATKEEALNVLSLSQESNSEIKLLGCYKYPLLDQEQINIIEKRKNDTSDEKYNIANKKSELNPQDGEGLKFWNKDRIAKYGNPTDSSGEEEALLNEVNQKNETLLNEKAKNSSTRNKEVIKTTEEELKVAVLKLKLAPYMKKYQNSFKNATKYAEDAKTAWEEVAKFVEDATLTTIRTNYSEVQEEISRLQQHKNKDPYDPKMQIRITEAYQQKEEYKEKLWEKTLELGPLITKAEVMSSRKRSYGAELNSTMGKIQKLIFAFEKSHKPLDNRWDYKDKPDLFKDVVVSVKNAQSADMPACLTFERKEDQCKMVKPSAKRACQLAKVKIGGAKEWAGGDNDKWRDEVLELIEEIFTMGCARLNGDFAKGINSILKAYLTKQVEPENDKEKETVSGFPNIERTRQNFISNYKITKEEDMLPPLPEKSGENHWDEIIAQLKKCRNDTKPLEFTVESSSSSPLRITHAGKPLPKILEQADMEFSFNWAVDSNFRIFATVLGLCSEELEDGLAKKFHDGYTRGFLDPIRPIWLDNRDNPIFSMILGQYYVTGKGDLWTKHCMEASYHRTGKLYMLPLRPIFVNSYTEPNYFAKGPLQGTRGPYYGTTT